MKKSEPRDDSFIAEQLKQDESCFFGFVDSSINRVVSSTESFCCGCSMVISCLDSSTKVSSATSWLKRLKENDVYYKAVGDAVWVPSNSVRRLFGMNFTFYGFDEIFFVNAEPLKAIAADETGFTTDGNNFSCEVPAEFWKIWSRLNATCYLADGCGLNYVANSKELVYAILRSKLAKEE